LYKRFSYFYFHFIKKFLPLISSPSITGKFGFSLSLTGKLLYPIADLFVVCWENLQERYPLTHLVTSFVPKQTCSQNKRR
jgi:hypothetical protein